MQVLSVTFSELKSSGVRTADPAHVAPISEEEFQDFLSTLSTSREPCALLRISPGYSARYKPEELKIPLPKSLSELYDSTKQDKSLAELIEFAERCMDSYNVTPIQAERIEVLTRAQHKSRIWFQFRQGRITASLFYDVFHTNMKNPARSLLQRICYPLESRFHSEATR